jgi:hypothetical protein
LATMIQAPASLSRRPRVAANRRAVRAIDAEGRPSTLPCVPRLQCRGPISGSTVAVWPEAAIGERRSRHSPRAASNPCSQSNGRMPVPTAAVDAQPKPPVVGFPRSAKDLDRQESMPKIHADNITMNGDQQGSGESLVFIGELSTVPPDAQCAGTSSCISHPSVPIIRIMT